MEREGDLESRQDALQQAQDHTKLSEYQRRNFREKFGRENGERVLGPILGS